jgi:hypothetical protein
MSSNALITIIAPLDLDRVADAEAAIDVLGNPARSDIRAALDRHEDVEHGTHFASFHAFKSQDGKRAYLAFEFSADGPEADALARIDRQIGEHLRPVFTLASDWNDGELLAYLRSHTVTPGNGWFSSPGLLFAGTPGLTVGRIWREAKLASFVTGILSRQPADWDALSRVEDARKQVVQPKEFKHALQLGVSAPLYKQPTWLRFITRSAVSFAEDLSLAGRCDSAGLCRYRRCGRCRRRIGLLGDDRRRTLGLCLRAVDRLLDRPPNNRAHCSHQVTCCCAERKTTIRSRSARPRATNRRDVRAREPARLRAKPHDIESRNASRAPSAGSRRASRSGRRRVRGTHYYRPAS